jgi:glycine/D-amino acid oxidase-like deaminating enzyme
MTERMIIPRDHIDSYYAASIDRPPEFSPLAGDQIADVCVVGAGFTGISAALHLAERGYAVHVVEANRVGWGASGRNGGQMIGGISGEARLGEYLGEERATVIDGLRWEGHRIIEQRVRDYGIDCDLKYGYLDVAIKERHMDALREDAAHMEEIGFAHEFRLLSGAETQEFIGTDAYMGSLLNMANGHLHPLKLCIGEALAAHNLGVTISEHSPVTEIKRGSKPKVITANGSVTSEAVIIAGNAYHALERQLRGTLLPVNSFIIATEPLDEDTVRTINPHDLAVCDPNYVLEYFRLSADKRLLFGGRCNYFGQDPGVIERHLRPRMSRIYPMLKDVRIEYAWGGTIGVPLNRVPQLGQLAPQIFYCQGYSGHGVNVTHLAGRILADAVGGVMEHFDLFANCRSPRVPGLYTFRKPLVQLGIMLYQIRDRL